MRSDLQKFVWTAFGNNVLHIAVKIIPLHLFIDNITSIWNYSSLGSSISAEDIAAINAFQLRTFESFIQFIAVNLSRRKRFNNCVFGYANLLLTKIG